jgi:hypothetical protein
MIWWLVAVAHGASPWVDVEADVRVQQEVSVAPELVTAAFSDFDRLEALYTPECLKRWAHGVPAAGVGARSRVSYAPGLMNRRLTAVVVELEPGRKVLLDHEGPGGFFTKITVEAAGEGSLVTVHTPLNPPPWPFRKLFHLEVKPVWTQCYLDALRVLDEEGS